MKCTTRTLLAPISVGMLILLAATGVAGCKKDEPPPPLPAAAPETETATLELKPIDAGLEEEEEEEAPRTGGGGRRAPASGLTACCQALQQNAANAPEPTRTYMVQAAAMCQAAAAQGSDKASAVGMITGALKGAGMPAACR